VQHQRDLVTVTRARRPDACVPEEEDEEVGKRQLTAMLAQIEGLEARCQVRTLPLISHACI
jgi:hypothetical protein